MKKTCYLFLLNFSLIFFLGSAASAESDYHEIKISGDYIQPLSTLDVTGDVMENAYHHLLSRFLAFSEEYDCDVYLWMWKTEAAGTYGSFEQTKQAIENQADADSVYILYMDDIKKAYVHMGDDVVPDYDTSQLIQILCEDTDKDGYDKIVRVYDQLCSSANALTGKYVTHLYTGYDMDRQAVKDAAIPIHEVFPGYVCIDYFGEDTGAETSVLRNSQNIDYDNEFAKWEHKLEYYFRDTVYITYFAKTGRAFIDIGEETPIHLSKKTLEKIETSFSPSTPDDISGFQEGIAELAANIQGSAESPLYQNIGIWIVIIVGICLLLLVVIVKKKQKRNHKIDQ